jgi:signal transduction histidine kinase
VVVRVADTGMGVPEQVRDHLFEPFVTSKGPDRGTGLGLALSHGILRDYDAAIALEDTGPDGTVFRITFPQEEA